MKKILSLVLAVLMMLGCVSMFASCGETGSNNEELTKDTLKIALICQHGDSSTYDKNFIIAFKTACSELGLKEENCTFVTDIPEGDECYTKAAEFADDGYDIVFADSFGHEPFMIKAAKEFPNVQFCHATGTLAHTEKLANFHDAFASIYEGRYLTGIAAGLKLVELYGDAEGKVSDENAKVGYVGAHPYDEIKSGYTAFYLGVKSVVSNATMEVRYTNEWFDEAAEKTTALALIDNGCKLISQHADSMGAPTACEERGIPNVAYNGSTGKDTFVIASSINWVPYFKYIVNCVLNNEPIDEDWLGGMDDGVVVLSELGKAAAAGTQEKIDAAKAELLAGTRKVFDCSTFTVKGQPVTEYIADVDNGDYVPDTNVVKTANGITYIAEGELRSAPYMGLIIDGITVVTDK